MANPQSPHTLLRTRGPVAVECGLFVTILLGLAGWIHGLGALPVGGRDYVVFMHGVYRLQQGQIPHTDFYMPLGLLNFALPALLSKTGLPLYPALVLALTLLAWSLAVCCYFLLHERSRWLASVLSAAIFLYGAGWVRLGEETFVFTRFFTIHLFYNRLGCAAVMLTTFTLYAAFTERRALSAARQAVLAWCAFVCFYVKLSYFVLFILVFGLWLLSRRLDGARAGTGCLLWCFAGLNLLVVSIYGLPVFGDYLLDVAAAGQASIDARAARFTYKTLERLHDPKLLNHPATIAYLSCCLAVLADRLLRARGSGVVLHWLATSVLALLTIVYFSMTNSGPIETPVLTLPIFLTWIYLVWQSDRSELQSFFAWVALFVVFARGVAVAGAVGAMAYPDGPLYTPAGNLGTLSQVPAGFVDYVESATHMLNDLPVGSLRTVLVFDLSNVLTPVLQIASPKHVPLFFHQPLDWSPRCAASFARLSADVDTIMIPKQPLFPEETRHLVEYYGAELDTHFRPSATDDHWTRYERKPGLLKPDADTIPRFYCER
jgi:hypothetical protein